MRDEARVEWDTFWSGRDHDIKVTLGVDFVGASSDHVELAMPFRREIAQATGVFSAGALVQLADMAATWLCLRSTGALRDDAAPFPLSVQMNAHLIANTTEGLANARAKLLSASRSMLVAETVVTAGSNARTLLVLTSTHLVRPAR